MTYLCVATAIAAGAEPAREEPVTLVAAIPQLFAPEYIKDKQNQPTGFAIDVMDRLAARLGIRIEYREYSNWQTAMFAVASGAADLIPMMGITQERANQFVFSRPLGTLSIAFFVRETSDHLVHPSDLRGRGIGVVRANAAVQLLRNDPDLVVTVSESIDHALLSLLSGEVDAIAYPAQVVEQLAFKSGLADRIRRIEPPLKEIKRGVALRADLAHILPALNLAIDELLESPEFAELYAKWFGAPMPYWTAARVFLLMGAVMVILLVAGGTRWLAVTSRMNEKLRTQVAALNEESALREASEQQLKSSELKLRTLVESPMQAIVVHRYGKPLFANQAFIDLCGLGSLEELEKAASIDMFLHPADLPKIHRLRETALRREAMPRTEFRMRRRDGTAVWVSGAGGMVEWDGEAVFEATLVDISERKAAESELLEREARFRAVIENSVDLITLVDSTGHVALISPSVTEILGFEVEEQLGRPARELLHPDDQVAAHEILAGREDGTSVFVGPVRVRLRHKDGSWRTVDVRGRRLTSASGEPLTILNSRDVTEEEHREAKLIQSQKLEGIGLLAGGIAHDFNNLLLVILTSSEMLLEEFKGNAAIREDLERIIGAGERAAGLIGQLLTFSRQQQFSMELLELGSTVSQFHGMLRQVIGEDIQLSVTIAPGQHWVLADQIQIEQVLMNLVINARDAMPDGGKVVLSLRRYDRDLPATDAPGVQASDKAVILSVSDSGTGIAADDLNHIFEPYFTTKDQGKGTGLGLATSYGIVLQMGGTIQVESRPGEGATFSIHLPLQEPPASLPKSVEVNSVDRRGIEQVLLVEDEEFVRQAASRILRKSGYTVIEAENGEEALQIWRNKGQQIDLLVTDVVMPNMSGWALSRELRVLNPSLRVLYMSGYTDRIDESHETLEEGTAFLQKPFTKSGLLNAVRDLLDT